MLPEEICCRRRYVSGGEMLQEEISMEISSQRRYVLCSQMRNLAKGEPKESQRRNLAKGEPKEVSSQRRAKRGI